MRQRIDMHAYGQEKGPMKCERFVAGKDYLRRMTCNGDRRYPCWAVMAGKVNATGITPGTPKSDVDT